MKKLLEKMLRFNQSQKGLKEPLIWPALIGPTSAGKTTLAEEVAEAMEARVERLLVALIPEHELLGIPRVVEDPELGLIVKPALPDWAARAVQNTRAGTPTIVLLDELDKVHAEGRLSALLTLLAERRIHNTVLPSSVMFVAAMQPPRASFFTGETGQALMGRLCFIPKNEADAWNALKVKHGKHSAELDTLMEGLTEVKLPPRLNTIPRCADWVLGIMPKLTREELEIVAYGCLSPNKAAALLDSRSTAIRPDEIIAALASDISIINTMSHAELLAACDSLWVSEHSTPQVIEAMTAHVIEHLPPEELRQAITRQVESVFTYAAANAVNGEVEILKPYTEQEVADAFVRGLHKGGTARAKALGLEVK